MYNTTCLAETKCSPLFICGDGVSISCIITTRPIVGPKMTDCGGDASFTDEQSPDVSQSCLHIVHR
jgi:hypothetical protein